MWDNGGINLKKLSVLLICIIISVSGCTQNKSVSVDELRIGDTFSVTGMVSYSNEPSDIGQEYCYVTGDREIEYYYMDIYDKESKWQSNVFYTKGDDTDLLKDYVGCEVEVLGIFDAECHGIPYITQIKVLD